MAFDPVSAILEIGSKVIDRVWPDPVAAANAKLELIKLQQSGELTLMAKQLDINLEEAKSDSIFKGGWRPAVGWVCVFACAWNWVVLSMVSLVLQLLKYDVVLKPADVSEMMPILVALLGLGAYRMNEKIKGVS